MIDHSRIKSGFDCEVLLGAEFFRMAFHALFDSGQFETKHHLVEGGASVVIDRPTKTEIMFGEVSRTVTQDDGKPVIETGEVDLSVAFPATFYEATGNVNNTELGLFLKIKLTELVNEKTGLVNNIDMEVSYAGLHQESWDWLVDNYTLIAAYAADTKLRENLQIALPGLIPGDFQKMHICKLPAVDGFQACYAVYVNLDLKVGPTEEVIPAPPGSTYSLPTIKIIPPEPDAQPVDRGDWTLGLNFLPRDRHVVMGSPRDIYGRLSKDRLHSFTEETSPGVYSRPLKNRSEEVIGQLSNISVKPGAGEIVVKATTRTEGIKAETVIHVILRIEENGELKVDIKVDEPEADVSFFDFAALFLGQALTLGLAPLTGGLSLGAGLIMSGMTISMLHAVKEGYEAQGLGVVEGMVKDKQDSLLGFLDTIPSRVTIVKFRHDPFYYRHFQVVTLFREVNIRSEGMSFAGMVIPGGEDIPLQDVKLVGRVREEEPVGSLRALLYRVPRRDEIVEIDRFQRPDPRKKSVFLLNWEEVIKRVAEKQLRKSVLIRPERVRVRDGRITEMFFDTRVALAPFEAAEFQLNQVLTVLGARLVRPRQGRPYYRTKPDAFEHNNLPNLPQYNAALAATLAGEFSDFNSRVIEYAGSVPDDMWHWVPEGESDSAGIIAYHAISTYSLIRDMVAGLANAESVPDTTVEDLDTASIPDFSPDGFKRSDPANFLPAHGAELYDLLVTLTTEQLEQEGQVSLYGESMTTQRLIEKLLDYLWDRLNRMNKVKDLYKKSKG